MTQPDPDPKSDPDLGEVRQLRSYVFSREGPFPPARFHHRLISFCLDFTLVGALGLLILIRFILPTYFPAELSEFNAWYAEYTEQLASGERPLTTHELRTQTWSEPVLKMLLFSQNFILFFFWIYFGGAEVFYQGKTIGKRAFRLKVMDMNQVRPLDLFPAMMRSLIKTLCLFAFFPLFLLSYLAAWFTPFRRTGHDYLSRSIVVEDNHQPEEKESATLGK